MEDRGWEIEGVRREEGDRKQETGHGWKKVGDEQETRDG